MDGVTKEGWNILHVSSVYSDKNILSYLLIVLKDRMSTILSPECPSIFTKLAIAPLEKLLETACRKKNTPFLLAVKYNRLDAIKILIE